MSFAGFCNRYPDASASWNQNPLDVWRKPDVDFPDLAIWYGPDGPQGDCATLVERVYDQRWQVTRYDSVVGYEWYNPKDYKPFLTATTEIIAPSARLAAEWGTAYLGYYGGDEDWEDELP